MAEWEQALPRIKAACRAWNDTKGGSIDTWLDLVADQVDWRSLGDGRLGIPWTKKGKSKDEVRAYLSGLTSTFRMGHYTMERFVCQDDCVVAIGRTAWTGIKSGKYFETPIVTVWRFKDGKAISFFEYYDTATVLDAAN